MNALNDEQKARALAERDAVMAEVDRRVGVIVRRRRIVTTAMVTVGLLMAGGAMALWLPQSQQEPVLVAEQRVVVEPTPAEPTLAEPETAPEAEIQKTTVEAVKVHRKAKPAKAEPVVMCNNQCDADSVISEIWKFLSV